MPVGMGFSVADGRDALADGKPDILWREVGNGDLYIWYMDGATMTDGRYLSPARAPPFTTLTSAMSWEAGSAERVPKRGRFTLTPSNW